MTKFHTHKKNDFTVNRTKLCRYSTRSYELTLLTKSDKQTNKE